MTDARMTRSAAAATEMRADDAQARHHFRVLDHEQQAQAIRRLAAVGHGDDTIARATGLAVEQMRRVLTD